MKTRHELYLEIHNKMSEKNGLTPKALWGSEYSQIKRFEVFSKILNHEEENVDILDFGSGLGHLYEYLINKNFKINYTGLEINKNFYDISARKYQDARFILGDINSLDRKQEFDYVFASGIYNLGSIFEMQNAFKSDFDILFSNTKRACVINFLSKNSPNQDNISVYHDCKEIIRIIEDNFSKKYDLYHNYLPNDFTIVIWREY